MSPKVLAEIRHLNKALSNNSWRNYLNFLRALSETVDSPSLPQVITLLENGRIEEAVSLSDYLSEQMYSTAQQHFAANQIAALIRKYPFPDELNPFDPEEEAVRKFWLSESFCAQTNFLLRSSSSNLDNALTQKMIDWIRYTIGSCPSLSEIYEHCGFGPGASVGVHGNATHLGKKLLSRWSVTPSAFDYARSACVTDQHIIELLVRDVKTGITCLDPECFFEAFRAKTDIVDYNKIAFVPKTVKTYRSIAVEPLMNSFVQKGIDVVLRKRLRRIGLDLTDQSSNSELARQGSVRDGSDSFVTIDLSSASDNISIELVKLLLPYDWYYLLDSIRSKNFLLRGKKYTFEKFCSMGNGFCFPLQTLLFAAACTAVGCGSPGTDFLVYGDDIIVRQKHAKALLALLGSMGFKVNADKTFLEGPFRESCGRDWFNGEDVRPFILDFRLDSLQALFKIINLSQRNSRTETFLKESMAYIKSLIPHRLRFCRPSEGAADSAYRCELDEFMSSPYARYSRNLQSWTWVELGSVPVADNSYRARDDSGSLLIIAALRGVSSSAPFTIRRMTRTKVRRVTYCASPAREMWAHS